MALHICTLRFHHAVGGHVAVGVQQPHLSVAAVRRTKFNLALQQQQQRTLRTSLSAIRLTSGLGHGTLQLSPRLSAATSLLVSISLTCQLQQLGTRSLASQAALAAAAAATAHFAPSLAAIRVTPGLAHWHA
jgi:hypothetical protein